MVVDRLRCVSAPLHVQISYTDSLSPIGSPSDPVRIKSIDISPDPPLPGQDLTVTVVGEAKERIEVRFIRKISRYMLAKLRIMAGGCICGRYSQSRRYQAPPERVRSLRRGVRSPIFNVGPLLTCLLLCRRNAEAEISCPVEKGTHKVVHTVTLPKEIPKGTCDIYSFEYCRLTLR